MGKLSPSASAGRILGGGGSSELGLTDDGQRASVRPAHRPAAPRGHRNGRSRDRQRQGRRSRGGRRRERPWHGRWSRSRQSWQETHARAQARGQSARGQKQKPVSTRPTTAGTGRANGNAVTEAPEATASAAHAGRRPFLMSFCQCAWERSRPASDAGAISMKSNRPHRLPLPRGSSAHAPAGYEQQRSNP